VGHAQHVAHDVGTFLGLMAVPATPDDQSFLHDGVLRFRLCVRKILMEPRGAKPSRDSTLGRFKGFP
ncbi:MAG: hypothetical protein EBU61_07315, partial [Crocinitomicaceae bacterium]|nr:hypothetical protein [Crocinitomicaceae bacterium]